MSFQRSTIVIVSAVTLGGAVIWLLGISTLSP
jgi:hypothetical protein